MDFWHILLSLSLLLSLAYGQVWKWVCKTAISSEEKSRGIAWGFFEKLESCQVLTVELASTNHILREKADKYDLLLDREKEAEKCKKEW